MLTNFATLLYFPNIFRSLEHIIICTSETKEGWLMPDTDSSTDVIRTVPKGDVDDLIWEPDEWLISER